MSYQTILSRSVTKAEKKDPSVSGILHPAWFVGSWKSQFSVLLKVLWHGKVQGGSFKTQAQIPEARFCHPYRSPGYWKLGQQSLWPLQPSGNRILQHSQLDTAVLSSVRLKGTGLLGFSYLSHLKVENTLKIIFGHFTILKFRQGS